MSDTLNAGITPNITFNEIPANLQVPGEYIEIAPNYSDVGLLPLPARMLAVGQMFGAGLNPQATPGQVYRVENEARAALLFGAGSPLFEQLRTWFFGQPGIPVDAIGLQAPVGATAASGGLLFAGAARTVGSQAIEVAGRRVVFTIKPGDTPLQMARNFVTAAGLIDDARYWPVNFTTTAGTSSGSSAAAGVDPDGNPITLANGTPTGTVKITPIVKGALSNEYDIRVNPSPRDVTVPGVTIGVTAMTGGTGTPSVAGAIATIQNVWYTDVQFGWSDLTTLGALSAELDARFGAMAHLDGYGYTAWDGTQGQLATNADGFNGKFISALGVTNFRQPTWVIGAALAAVAARATLDDPARQLRGLVLPGILPPARADRFSQDEQQAMLLDGIATWDATADNQVALQRLVSTYTQTPDGIPDSAWQDIMVAKTMSRIRYDFRQYMALTYPRAKLADDDAIAAEFDQRSLITPRRAKAAWAARCTLYARAGWIENTDADLKKSFFVRDPNNRNRLNGQLNITIIGNKMVDAFQLLFAA